MGMLGCSVWSKEVPNHINPGAPGVGKVRFYQFVAKLSFDTMQFEGYRATSFARATTWSAGARRQASPEPKLLVRSGGSFGVINVHTPSSDQLSARSWWPASEGKRIASKPRIYWYTADAGLTSEIWAGFPKLSVSKLQPLHFPYGEY